MKVLQLGLGTVGTGVVKVLEMNQEKIHRKLGEPLEIQDIIVYNIDKKRTIQTENYNITDDFDSVKDNDYDLVVELIGGTTRAKEMINHFLNRGIPVVTANKDLLALNIDEFEQKAQDENSILKYEAAVAGGIPIIRAIDTSLHSNEITRVMGILNGTTNFILCEMKNGKSYKEALELATELGYAESDPTNDVDGLDAQRKTLLLARLAFNRQFDLKDIKVNGIKNVELLDINTLNEHNATIKLIGDAEKTENGIRISVENYVVPNTHPLYGVHGATNAVYVYGNAVHETVFTGPGAGETETASSVVSDMMNIFLDNKHFDIPTKSAHLITKESPSDYYVRAKEPINHLKNECVNKKDNAYILREQLESDLARDNNISVYYKIIGDM